MSDSRPPRRCYALCCAIGLGCALAATVGCQTVIDPPNDALERLLKPVATARDSVTLEIFYARIPLEEDAAADQLWQQVDEQCFDAELRRRLMANGLRVGVVSGSLPAQLSDLLALGSEMPDSSSDRVIDGQSATPRVMRQVKQINRRNSMSIQASEPRDKATILVSEEQGLGGGEYEHVVGVYTLRAESAAGQRVVVQLIPELHYGEFRNRYAGSDQGTFVTSPSQERKVFDRLAMEASLAPGDMLVLGCLPDARTSLGGTFHYANSGGRQERKLILVRLLEVPPTEILAKK
jgi:hypothetical protein